MFLKYYILLRIEKYIYLARFLIIFDDFTDIKFLNLWVFGQV